MRSLFRAKFYIIHLDIIFRDVKYMLFVASEKRSFL